MADQDTNHAVVDRLAQSLTYALSIPEDGNHLLAIAAGSNVKTNMEAVQAWVYRNIAEPDTEIARRVLPLLIDRLEAEIRHDERHH